MSASLNFLMASDDFVELVEGDEFHIDLRYGSANNFVGRDMYGSFRRAFLHRVAAEKLNRASAHLRQAHPGCRFIIFDALRPRSIQRILWNHVVGTPNQRYLADPDLGSLHNFGFAVDLSILDPAGREWDMGAGFDDFREVAHPQWEERFLNEGVLSEGQVGNRRALRNAMAAGGFTPIPHEWWHFDALPKAEVRAGYRIVE